MLTATRARAFETCRVAAAPASCVDTRRHRLVAALAEERPGALGLESPAASRDGRCRRSSPARSAASCPQAAPISWPRLRRIVTGMPTASRRAANRSIAGIGLAVHGVWATGFIGIRLTCARSPRRTVARASASTSVSFTPPIIVYS